MQNYVMFLSQGQSLIFVTWSKSDCSQLQKNSSKVSLYQYKLFNKKLLDKNILISGIKFRSFNKFNEGNAHHSNDTKIDRIKIDTRLVDAEEEIHSKKCMNSQPLTFLPTTGSLKIRVKKK